MTNSIPPDSSSVQTSQNGTVMNVMNGSVESEMKGEVSAGGVRNKAYVVEDRD